MTRSSIYADRDGEYAGTEDHSGLSYEQLAAQWERHMVALYGSKAWDTIDTTPDAEKE